MSRRSIIFCVFALLAAFLFVRLGFWQLARLHAKLQRNATIAAQQRAQPVEFASLPRDTAAAHYRRASASGVFDYESELVASARTYQGSPGVKLITPLRLAGSDTVVLVDRGSIPPMARASIGHAGARAIPSPWPATSSSTHPMPARRRLEEIRASCGASAGAKHPRGSRGHSRRTISSRLATPRARTRSAARCLRSTRVRIAATPFSGSRSP